MCRATVACDIETPFLEYFYHLELFKRNHFFKVKIYSKFYLFASVETRTLRLPFIYILILWLTVKTVIFSYFLQMLFLKNFTINFPSDNKLLSKSYTINY